MATPARPTKALGEGVEGLSPRACPRSTKGVRKPAFDDGSVASAEPRSAGRPKVVGGGRAGGDGAPWVAAHKAKLARERRSSEADSPGAQAGGVEPGRGHSRANRRARGCSTVGRQGQQEGHGRRLRRLRRVQPGGVRHGSSSSNGDGEHDRVVGDGGGVEDDRGDDDGERLDDDDGEHLDDVRRGGSDPEQDELKEVTGQVEVVAQRRRGDARDGEVEGGGEDGACEGEGDCGMLVDDDEGERAARETGARSRMRLPTAPPWRSPS